MNLGELINKLEQHNPSKKVPLGFSNPHSHNGNDEELAFELAFGTTVGEMLEYANDLWLGYQYSIAGQKQVTLSTPVYLATEGNLGESIGVYLLNYMMGMYN